MKGGEMVADRPQRLQAASALAAFLNTPAWQQVVAAGDYRIGEQIVLVLESDTLADIRPRIERYEPPVHVAVYCPSALTEPGRLRFLVLEPASPGFGLGGDVVDPASTVGAFYTRQAGLEGEGEESSPQDGPPAREEWRESAGQRQFREVPKLAESGQGRPAAKESEAMADMLSWLRQQIETRKALAEAADAASPGPWTNTGQDGCGNAWQIHGAPTGETEPDWDDPNMEEIPVLARVATLNYDDGGGVWEEDAADHIVLNQPRDVIARCGADLLILDEHTAVADPYSPTGSVCKTCNDGGLPVEPACWPCRTVRTLASGYRHCPGWSPDWAPEEQESAGRPGYRPA